MIPFIEFDVAHREDHSSCVDTPSISNIGCSEERGRARGVLCDMHDNIVSVIILKAVNNRPKTKKNGLYLGEGLCVKWYSTHGLCPCLFKVPEVDLAIGNT